MIMSIHGSSRQQHARREAILDEVRREQQMNVAELSRRFNVSEVSIRRDLEQLERLGLLRRVHGGAQAVSRSGQATMIQERLMRQAPVKAALGQAAAGLIRPGDAVFLDSGTTVLEIARHIPTALLEGGGLTVVTRSLMIADLLREHRQTRLIVLGGLYAHDFDDFVGRAVEEALAGLHVDTLFIGSDGATAEGGLTTDNVLEAGLYRLMARSAERVVVIIDSGKIGVNQVQATLAFEDIHTFITDSAAPPAFLQMLVDLGLEVIQIPRPAD